MNTKKRKILAKDIQRDHKLSEEVKIFLGDVNTRTLKRSKNQTVADERQELNLMQSSVQFDFSGVDEMEKVIISEGHQIKLTLVRPSGNRSVLPAFIFLHGGGWITGNYQTHKRLVHDLVSRSGCVAIFVNYSLSPEAVYPKALNESYAALTWVHKNGAEINVDGTNLAIVGNSSGGNLATVTAMIASEKSGPEIKLQILLWPVVEAGSNQKTSAKFGEGRYLTTLGLHGRFASYAPDKRLRRGRFVSPLNTKKKELQGLPPALILLAQSDVSRHAAQAYARKLSNAGIPVTAVRYNGMIHDFGLFNALAELPQTEAVINQTAATLKQYLQPV